MNINHWFKIKLGKCLLGLARIYGGGSALPGLFMEKFYPDFVKNALTNLKYGVVVVSGTNGKTSTTKALSQILSDQGLQVFTNPSGSNFLRGIASALLRQCDSTGNIKADIAVLELDEAHAQHFTKQIKPDYCLLLNIMRDQLDRFGEIDKVRNLLEYLAQTTKHLVVLNREDSHLRSIAKKLQHVIFYGYSDQVGQQLQNLDDELSAAELPEAAVELVYHGAKNANIYRLGKRKLSVNLKMSGLYNHFNIAGALALAQNILGDKLSLERLEISLEELEPAFGRGEKFLIGGQSLELILVKNPSGFQMAINSLINPEASIMIAANDAYADGRDLSWLWDVDFTRIPQKTIHSVSGTRCWELANRLKYDNKTCTYVQSDINSALNIFLANNQVRQIYASYTAMLQIRKALLKAVKGEKL